MQEKRRRQKNKDNGNNKLSIEKRDFFSPPKILIHTFFFVDFFHRDRLHVQKLEEERKRMEQEKEELRKQEEQEQAQAATAIQVILSLSTFPNL